MSGTLSEEKLKAAVSAATEISVIESAIDKTPDGPHKDWLVELLVKYEQFVDGK